MLIITGNIANKNLEILFDKRIKEIIELFSKDDVLDISKYSLIVRIEFTFILNSLRLK